MSTSADEAVAIAKQEVEYRVELFNKMVSSCYQKCIDTKFKDGQLTVGENSCVDRCSAKYWQVVAMIGTMLSGQK
ncbi:hypothetical protein BSKO_08480 [Bryopsis sp. KO-2023]|nr:hypothetical protein BSKO_08480 [Bryopsis sp. KO-2023]